MGENKNKIDMTGLEQSKQRVSEKINQLNEFFIRISFLFVGAIIAAPLNLLLRPITYQDGDLAYGPATLLTSASWWVIPIHSILLLISLVILILIGYTVLIGLVGRERTTITYQAANQEEFITKFTEYIIKQGDYHGMDVEYQKGRSQSRSIEILGFKIGSRSRRKHILKCTDPYRRLAHNAAAFAGPMHFRLNSALDYFYPKIVAEFEFEQRNDEIHIQFDPHNKKCSKMLDDIMDKFGGDV
jgi:hypothetical protein